MVQPEFEPVAFRQFLSPDLAMEWLLEPEHLLQQHYSLVSVVLESPGLSIERQEVLESPGLSIGRQEVLKRLV